MASRPTTLPRQYRRPLELILQARAAVQDPDGRVLALAAALIGEARVLAGTHGRREALHCAAWLLPAGSLLLALGHWRDARRQLQALKRPFVLEGAVALEREVLTLLRLAEQPHAVNLASGEDVEAEEPAWGTA